MLRLILLGYGLFLLADVVLVLNYHPKTEEWLIITTGIIFVAIAGGIHADIRSERRFNERWTHHD